MKKFTFYFKIIDHRSELAACEETTIIYDETRNDAVVKFCELFDGECFVITDIVEG